MIHATNLCAPLMTVRDLAQYLQKSEAWVYRKSRGGELPTIMVGRSRRFNPAVLNEWLDDRTTSSADHPIHAIDSKPARERTV